MLQRKLVTLPALVLAFGAQLVQANPNPSSQQFIKIYQQQQGLPGANSQQTSKVAATTLQVPTGGAIHISNTSGQVQVNTLDPTQPQRVLVRLKDQPLRPYLKQQRDQLAVAGKLSRSAQQQLAKSSQSHLQRVQKSQTQVLAELRKQKLIQQVHGQFTQLTNTLSITAAPNTIEQIRRLPQVAEVYPDNKVEAFLAESVGVTKAPQVWSMRDGLSRAVTGQGVKVAVLDYRY